VTIPIILAFPRVSVHPRAMGSPKLSSSEVRHAKCTQQPGPCADLVDAFGRVHIRVSEDLPGHADRGTPTVLTKLKKWAGTLLACVRACVAVPPIGSARPTTPQTQQLTRIPSM
jgi:hypothetical protein